MSSEPVWTLSGGWAIPDDDAETVHRRLRVREVAVLEYQGKEYQECYEAERAKVPAPCSLREAAHSMEYMWTEGNYSCDCNRALFVSRAGGAIPENVPCDNGVDHVVTLKDLRLYVLAQG